MKPEFGNTVQDDYEDVSELDIYKLEDLDGFDTDYRVLCPNCMHASIGPDVDELVDSFSVKEADYPDNIFKCDYCENLFKHET